MAQYSLLFQESILKARKFHRDQKILREDFRKISEGTSCTPSEGKKRSYKKASVKFLIKKQTFHDKERDNKDLSLRQSLIPKIIF